MFVADGDLVAGSSDVALVVGWTSDEFSDDGIEDSLAEEVLEGARATTVVTSVSVDDEKSLSLVVVCNETFSDIPGSVELKVHTLLVV